MLLAPPAADSDGESDVSDRVPVPSFQNSFSQAFEEALLQLDHGPTAPPQPVVIPGQSFTVFVCVLACVSDALFVELEYCVLILFLLSQMKRGGRRRRSRNRSFCSAPLWFTQSRWHWSWNVSLHLLRFEFDPSPITVIFPCSSILEWQAMENLLLYVAQVSNASTTVPLTISYIVQLVYYVFYKDLFQLPATLKIFFKKSAVRMEGRMSYICYRDHIRIYVGLNGIVLRGAFYLG